MNPLNNPLTQIDHHLLTTHHVEIEIDQVNPAAPVGVIIFNQRRFKVSILNQPGAGGVIAPTEEQMKVTASKVAVMLLKKELLQQQPQAEPLDLKINRQGMTLQNDPHHPIQHTDADDSKNTQPDYDALANYLTAPLPQPDAEIEEPEAEAAAHEANLDLVIHEHPHSQVPPHYIAVHPQLAAYIKNDRNPFLDSRFDLIPRNGQRLALMNGQQQLLAEQEKDAEIFIDPNVLRVIVEGWEAEAEERRRLQQRQEQRLLIEEVTEEAEAIQEKEPTRPLDPQSSAIVPIPRPIPSAAQMPSYHPAYLLLPPQMRMQWAAERVLGMNGVFLNPATRAALSVARHQPLTLTAAPQTREEAKTEQTEQSVPKDEQSVVTARSEQPVIAENESEVSDLLTTDLKQRRSTGFDWSKFNWLHNQKPTPDGLFDRNAFGRNSFEPIKDPFKSLDEQQRKFQSKSFPRPNPTPNTPTKAPKPASSPATTTLPIVPTPAPVIEPRPPKLDPTYRDPTLAQPGNEDVMLHRQWKQFTKQSGQSNPISSFVSNWKGFGQPQSNTQS